MTRVLALADEIAETMYGPRLTDVHPALIVACGDLPFDYLEYLVTMANVPLLYVPGNHDPEISERAGEPFDEIAPLIPRSKTGSAGPKGCINVDGRVTDAAGLRVAGLGGSIRYSAGPNQYTEAQMRRRARALERKRRGLIGRGRPMDLLISHAAPVGPSEGDDPAHRGAQALNWLIECCKPQLLVHGHIHPYGRPVRDHCVGSTTVINAVPYRCLEVET